MVHSDMNVIAWCNIAWDDGFGQQCGLNLDNLTGYAYSNVSGAYEFFFNNGWAHCYLTN